MKTFEELGVCESIRKAIDELGFVHPMPVQEAVIPYLLANENDVIALAQTGTGKTTHRAERHRRWCCRQHVSYACRLLMICATLPSIWTACMWRLYMVVLQ